VLRSNALVPDAPDPNLLRLDPLERDHARGIGERVAAHRAARALTVSELARAIGVSRSMVSQIERGQSRPSVSTLFALAEALRVPVDAFFRDVHGDETAAEPAGPGTPAAEPVAAPDRADPRAPQADRYLVRRDARAVIDIEGGVRWERLTPATLDEVEFLELVYAPQAESNASLYRHPGIEMVLVLSGRLDIFVGFEHYELGPGDSIWFPSTTPHRYLNPTDETTRAVTVLLRDPAGAPADRRADERPVV
jgi:transcriptional regulator with XRE-family HTH domain